MQKGYFVPKIQFYTLDLKISDIQIKIKLSFGLANSINTRTHIKLKNTKHRFLIILDKSGR